MSPEDLGKRVEALLAEARAINEALSLLSPHQLRLAGLHHRYNVSAVCSPWAANGTKPIIDERFEHHSHRVLSHDIDRAAYREKLRKAKMSEPMIWDRFPPITPEEKEEERTRLADWHRARPVRGVGGLLAPKAPDPFEDFLRLSARREARSSKRTLDEVLASEDFREARKREWIEIQALENIP